MMTNSRPWKILKLCFPTLGRCGFNLPELMAVIAVTGAVVALLLPAVSNGRALSESAACKSNLRQLYQANVLYASVHGDYVAAASDLWGANLERWHGRRSSVSEAFEGDESPLKPYLGSGAQIRACLTFDDYSENGFEGGCGGYGYNAVGVGSRSYSVGFYNGSSRGNAPSMIADPAGTIMFTDAAFSQYEGGKVRLIEYSLAEPCYHILDNEPEEGSPAYPSIHFRHQNRANVVWCDGHISSEEMAFSIARGGYGKLGLGWFGEHSNELFDPR